jgi:hypothetical protein
MRKRAGCSRTNERHKPHRLSRCKTQIDVVQRGFNGTSEELIDEDVVTGGTKELSVREKRKHQAVAVGDLDRLKLMTGLQGDHRRYPRLGRKRRAGARSYGLIR